MFFLKCSESGPLCPSCVLLSLFVDEPIECPVSTPVLYGGMCSPSFNTLIDEGSITRTTHGASSWCVCRVASACREPVLDVLHTLCLVRVREPVLAHEEVVAKANGAASHEDLGYGEGGHGGGRGCGVAVSCEMRLGAEQLSRELNGFTRDWQSRIDVEFAVVWMLD